MKRARSSLLQFGFFLVSAYYVRYLVRALRVLCSRKPLHHHNLSGACALESAIKTEDLQELGLAPAFSLSSSKSCTDFGRNFQWGRRKLFRRTRAHIIFQLIIARSGQCTVHTNFHRASPTIRFPYKHPYKKSPFTICEYSFTIFDVAHTVCSQRVISLSI